MVLPAAREQQTQEQRYWKRRKLSSSTLSFEVAREFEAHTKSNARSFGNEPRVKRSLIHAFIRCRLCIVLYCYGTFWGLLSRIAFGKLPPSYLHALKAKRKWVAKWGMGSFCSHLVGDTSVLRYNRLRPTGVLNLWCPRCDRQVIYQGQRNETA